MTNDFSKPISKNVQTPAMEFESFSKRQFIVFQTFLKTYWLTVIGEIKIKGKYFCQEIALLFDQLIDLVAAASTLHQAGGALNPDLSTGQEGEGHE
ncbi:hypothetical protein GWR56_13750 [Mucilaginibacter sp. 14171R-50]|uniref:hypothetical protein n=1 Tax=Mucilaginibacter sp. 14171R-50 TaxID=2703789 RepID=UPI00138D0DE0|nr:hypothetical protein [Mucilaginibacter sp. 14171R-50]QHS56553.1 hypothetical protein GWR56_13750 [Mucilaginibacter sp. 14171R-50]